MSKFKLVSKYSPAGGQGEAIKKLVEGYGKFPIQTLQGITGSGKTFVISNLIEKVNKPTLVLAHNKTLAAQLYQELKSFFPENRVEYFISYYDYYQPESYLPTSDTYIEKEATINTEIERMRLKTLASLLSRDDVIVVASISCIYGAGNPDDLKSFQFDLQQGQELSRSQLLIQLVDMLYERNDQILEPGKFRVRGETIDIFPSYDEVIYRIEFFGDEIDRILELDKVTQEKVKELDSLNLFPTKQFVIPEAKQEEAMKYILEELEERLPQLGDLEAHRLKKKVNYDMEMIKEMGYCTGIENYSLHFDKRKAGEPPFVLLDYFPKDFLFIIDESHQTLPQSRGMYNGDYSRKKNLVDFGFRLPSAYDNRPLKFHEFEKYFTNTVFVSATPGDYELEHSGQVVEQIIRPTGLLDPEIEVRPCEGQVRDVISQIKTELKENQKSKILVTTLTKRMAEDLTSFMAKEGLRVRYMHSDIDTLDRTELIRQLRADEYDVLIGINLLREGLDIPEVSLVAILDADKEGFLRNERSLIQTIGRAARNEKGKVIMYADTETLSMKEAIRITRVRREAQIEYNKKHNIVPKTVIKKVEEKEYREIKGVKHLGSSQVKMKIKELEKEMKQASVDLNFERAIELRDMIQHLEKELKFKKN